MSTELDAEWDVRRWAIQKRWSLEKFDSQSIKCGKKVRANPGLPTGTSDLVGNTDQGLAAYVEIKKLGHRDVCRMGQRIFLERKIRSNAFGLVTDSAIHLEEIYLKWLSLRSDSLQKAMEFLFSQLPRRVLVRGKVVTLGPS